MNSALERYVIIANRDVDGTWQQDLVQNMGVCKTFKKAYEISLFLARISKPDRQYKTSIYQVNTFGAVTISQIDGPNQATIVRVKCY